MDGIYIETSREHYCCNKIWTKKMRSIQVTDTVVFKHQYITIPTVSFFHVKQHVISCQQWHNPQHSTSHQSSDVISSRSWIWGVIHQHKIHGTCLTDAPRNGPLFSIITNKIISKATKTMDMHYHLLHDCKQQQQFWFYWWPGNEFCRLLNQPSCCITSESNKTPVQQHSLQNCQPNKTGGGWGSCWDMPIDGKAEHKNCVRDLTSCNCVLESPKSRTPIGVKGLTGQREK